MLDQTSGVSSDSASAAPTTNSTSSLGVSRVLPTSLADRIPVLEAGQVALVGAGPGDPGLLTINALMLIQQADVVVCDRLVSPEIVALKPAHAELVNAGKSCKEHVLTQDQTNQLLVDLAKEGKRVVRLKGGDPYIFGRGGEEVEVLMANQVESIVVPGITSASGCSAYAGFPLTHRDYAQSVTFITGHRKQDGSLDLDWPALSSSERTVVFYMGLSNADLISSQLQAHGRSGETPVGLIERGTTSRQRVAFTTLDKLVSTIKDEGFKPPTMMIVGEVVTLAEKNQRTKEAGLAAQFEQACIVG
ncbi:uroporphyrinogen-III C-methyltransferase [Litoribrevibacter albus]|uniref:uroporphyrinogen-III C-methyltransferase n=1 Tax=Litoribrevibacter albus TaxID=1473156 RepID=A0AA37S9G2_9GAMM|nr:uroporphyrinogen-III C-methyltransferase [Litoribrevibacter albus]GLQ30893.1 hypothetical protein GCM10007876_13720 [Litoribrevibacter albus]